MKHNNPILRIHADSGTQPKHMPFRQLRPARDNNVLWFRKSGGDQ